MENDVSTYDKPKVHLYSGLIYRGDIRMLHLGSASTCVGENQYVVRRYYHCPNCGEIIEEKGG